MNINLITTALLGIIFSGAATNLGAAGNSDDPVPVYLTAKNTGQQLTRMTDLGLSPLPQPAEHEACIFLDPQKLFKPCSASAAP